ncbi:MAG TPA: autotransporter-associated beta strand repeat-containing protein [Candidatus Binatia bacterium]|jgi:fibronectin-binding autotransporter adhesin|nr:autotransporter-associated beta strand repeat-containing protein [Candidatus Binatia bacterium]
MKRLSQSSLLGAALALLLLQTSPSAAQNYWTGFAGNTNWSDPSNWSSGLVPVPSDNLLFDNIYGSAVPTQGLVNNIANSSLTVSRLGFDTLTTSGYYTTQINPGMTLSIVPQTPGANAIAVGTWAASDTPAFGVTSNDQVYVTILGGGALVVNGPSTSIRIEQANAGTGNGANRATLDLSGLNTFTATVSNVLVGADGALNRDVGVLLLAQTNTITTGAWGTNVPGILLGRSPTDGGFGNLTLGKLNSFNTDWLAIGGYRANQANNNLAFASGITNGSLKVRGSSGGNSRANISIGDIAANESGTTNLTDTSRSQTGVAEFRGATVDIMADAIYLGRNLFTNDTINTGATGVGTGNLNLDAGTIDVNNLYLGYKIGSNYNGTVGNMIVSGTAAVTVNTNLQMCYRTYNPANAGTVTATLTVSSNAIVNVKGDVLKQGGAGTINLNDNGLLNLQPAGDPVPGNFTIDTLNLTGNPALLNGGNLTVNTTLSFNGGVISNASALNAATINTATGTITNVNNVTNGTALILGSANGPGILNVGGNLTFKTNASLSFALRNATTIGGGVNSYLNAGSNLAFLATNIISIAPLAPLTGPYRLVDYAGTLSGTPILTNTTRYSLGLDLSVPGQINLTNGGGAPVALTWRGTNSNWDLVTTNWNNSTVPTQKFFQDDIVTFDDTALATNVTVAGTLYPQSITVNATTNYYFTGSGKLSGNASLTKNGSGTLYITNTGGNDFTGPITVNAGILKLGRADALGATNGSTTIASGAMLDLAGTGANSPGEFVTISGTGITNAGAIINTRGDQNNGLRYVALAADASIGNWPGRWDIRGPGGNNSFSGGLYLNGYTLTKTGNSRNSVVDAVATNAGSIVVTSGSLAFTRSFLDGPGTVTVQGPAIFALENNTTGYVAKPFIFSGSPGTLQIPGGSPATFLFSPVTNVAGLTADLAANLTLTNVLTGAGSLTKISAGSLILQAPDLCTGPTTISAGGIVLTNAGSLANTPSITLASNATLNVSALPGFTLGGSQTLAGSGIVLGSVATSPGSTLSPGGSPGTLTITGDLTLNNNTTNLIDLGSDPTQLGDGNNDLISVGHNLALNGLSTLKLSALGPLNTATPYTVMLATNSLVFSGNLSDHLIAVSANPRYSFSIVSSPSIPNSVQIAVSGNPVSLIWQGGQPSNPTLWDTSTTSNWLNGATADVFFAGDSVTFDDSAARNFVTLGSVLQPGAITMNNSVNYAFGGTGGLLAGSLTCQGFGALTLTNTGTNFFALGVMLNSGTLALNQAADTAFASVLSDNGSAAGTFQKLGANTLTLAGNNSAYNGAILVSAGTLKPGSANALGTVFGGTTVAPGATLDIVGLNLGAEPLTASGVGVSNLGAIYNSGAGQQSALINVTLAGDTTVGGIGRWDIRTQTAIGNASLSTGGNPYKLTKVGANQISLVNAAIDDGLGDIDVQQGLFSLEHGTRSPNTGGIGDPSHTLTVFSNATLQINSLDTGLNKVIVLRDGATVTNQTGDNIVYGPVTLNGSNVFNIGTNSLSLNNTVNGSGTLYKLGGTSGGAGAGNANALKLSADNSTLSHGIFVANGTLMLLNSQAAGLNNTITVTTTTGGTGQNGTRVNLGNSVTIPPGVSLNLQSIQPGDLRSTLESDTGFNEWQGPIVFNGNGSINLAANQADAQLTISGPLSGILTNLVLRGNNQGIGRINGSINIGAARLEKTEVCLWSLHTNNNVWGDTIIHNGILQLGTNNPCPPSGFLTLGENTATCVLDLNGFGQQVSGLASAGMAADDFVVNSSTIADSTLTIAGTNITSFGGTIADAQQLNITNWPVAGSQRVGLTLASANTGSLALTGTNLYTGPTLVNGGALLVNGFLSNSVVTVNNGGALGGTGLLLGPVTVNSHGTLALGPAIGALAISNNLTLASGSTNVVKVNADIAANDKILGVSTLTYGGTLVLTNLGVNPLAGGTVLKLFDAAAYSGAFAAIVPATPGPSATWDTSNLAVDGTLKVVSTAPPYRPQFGTPALLGNGNFSLTFSGPAGFAYRVWGSTSVALAPVESTWTLLSSGTFGSVPVNFIDVNATNYPARFYEITVP